MKARKIIVCLCSAVGNVHTNQAFGECWKLIAGLETRAAFPVVGSSPWWALPQVAEQVSMCLSFWPAGNVSYINRSAH